MSVQKFEGIVEVEGITTDGAKGYIDFTPDIAEERSNFEVGDSLGTIIAKTNRNIEDLGELAFMDESDLPAFGDLATKDEVDLNIPRDIGDLTNDAGFGRPVVSQTYTTIDTNNNTTITAPTGRAISDIFMITINGTADNFSTSSLLIATGIAIHSTVDTSVTFINNVIGPDLAITVGISTIDTLGDFAGIAIDGEAALVVYYK